MKLKKILLYSLLLIVFQKTVYALEIYSLIRDDCQAQTGLIINTDLTSIYLLSIEGTYQKVPKDSISHILVYNTIQNPFIKLDTNSELKGYLRDVYTEDFDKPSFSGWPVKFLEGLVVFYDIQGKTHIINHDQIIRFRNVEREIKGSKPAIFEEAVFIVGNSLSQCDVKRETEKKRVFPNRVISSKIKISKFINDYDLGFKKLKNFQEITQFYSKPFLYDKKTKIGLNFRYPDQAFELPIAVPFYFQWSSGRPYSHQTFTVLGLKEVEWLPNVEPIFGVRMELKSHFLNAVFVGNAFGLSAGSEMMIKNSPFSQSFFQQITQDGTAFFPSINYLAMTGIDWGKYSFSGGPYYPVFGLNGNGVFREILSPSMSLVFRFLYYSRGLRLKWLYSDSDLGGTKPDEAQIQLIDSVLVGAGAQADPELSAALDEFHLKAGFTRIGFDLEINRDVNLGIDEVYIWGKYQETFKGELNRIDLAHYITRAYVTRQFGNYVMLKGGLNYYYRNYDSTFNQKKNSTKQIDYLVLGSIEFVL